MSEEKICECPDFYPVQEVATPLIMANGGAFYRLHVTGKAKYITCEDGSNLEERLSVIAKAINANLEIASHVKAGSGLRADASGNIWLDVPGMNAADRQTLLNAVVAAGFGISVNANGKLEAKPADFVDVDKGLQVSAGKIGVKVKGAGGITCDGNGLGVDIVSGGALEVSQGRISFRPAGAIDTANGLEAAAGKIGVKAQTGGGLVVGATGLGLDLLGNGGLALQGNKLYVKWADMTESVVQNIVRNMAGVGLAVNASGKVYVNFDSMPDSQMEQIVLQMVQSGGGLAVDKTGKIYVDFSLMPEAKFHMILNGLGLPVKFKRITYFYVHGGTGEDRTMQEDTTPDKTWGQTPANAFKTVTGALEYITSNFNLLNYTAVIMVHAGYTYEESPVLPDFTSTGGSITIRSWNGIAGDLSVPLQRAKIINRQTADNPTWAALTFSSKGSCNLYYLHLVQQLNCKFPANSNTQTSLYFQSQATGNLNLYGCRLTLDYSSPQISDLVQNPYDSIVLKQGNGGLSFVPAPLESVIEYVENATDGCVSKANFAPFRVSAGTLGFNYSNSSENTGRIAVRLRQGNPFMSCSGGLVSVGLQSSYAVPRMTFEVDEGYAVTGRRYGAFNGGRINTNGAGPDYFPGTTAGTEDASTFSWYK